MTSASETDVAEDASRTRLGHAVAGRLRRPGPRSGRTMLFPIGAVATSVRRFASGIQGPSALRRMIAATETTRPQQHVGAGAAVAPPKWWTPADEPAHTDELPAARRGLPRAVRRVPNEQTYTPGGIMAGLKPREIRPQRFSEVSVVGRSVVATGINAAQAAATVAAERHEQQRAAAASAGAAAGTVRRTSPAAASPTASAPPVTARGGARPAAAGPAVSAAPSPSPTSLPPATAPVAAAPVRRTPSSPVTSGAAPGDAASAADASASASTAAGSSAAPAGTGSSATTQPAPPGAATAPISPSAFGPVSGTSATASSAPSSRETAGPVAAVRREIADGADSAGPGPQASPGGVWRPTPASTRFAAALGAAPAPVATAPVASAAPTGTIRRATAEGVHATLGSRTLVAQQPSLTATAARVAPLRRMVGAPHAFSPATRSALRGAAVRPVPGTPRPGQMGGANAPAALQAATGAGTSRRGPEAVNSPLRREQRAATRAADDVAAGREPGSPARTDRDGSTPAASTSPSTPAQPTPVSSVPASSTSASSELSSFEDFAAAAQQRSAVVPLRRSTFPATATSDSHDVTAADVTNADVSNTVPTATAGGSAGRPAAPGGVPLSTTRSLRVMRSAALDLRPGVTSSGNLLAAARPRVPALPSFRGAAARTAGAINDSTTVVRRLTAIPAPASGTAVEVPATRPAQTLRRSTTEPANSVPSAPPAAQPSQPPERRLQPAAPPASPSAAGNPAGASTVSITNPAAAGERLASLAMTDQLAVRRMPSYGGNARNGNSLGSSFGADAPVSPATTAHGAGGATGLVRSGIRTGTAGGALTDASTSAVFSPSTRAGISAAGVPSSARPPAGTTFGTAPISQSPLRRSAVPQGPAPTAPAASAAPPIPASASSALFATRESGSSFVTGTGLPTAAGVGTLASAGSAPAVPAVAAAPIFAAADPGSIIRRSLSMAPPPISIRPGSAGASAAPATPRPTEPAGATASLSSAATGTPASKPSELYNSVADLFRTFNESAPPGTMDAAQTGPGGSTAMTGPVIRREASAPASTAPSSPDASYETSQSGVALSSTQLEELVDEVVDRIEQRVIDELERRGRRADPGVF